MKQPEIINTETAKGHNVGQVTAGTIGVAFDFAEISRDCPMKCDAEFIRRTTCGLLIHKARYPYKCDCNETNCILMHLLRAIVPMLVK